MRNFNILKFRKILQMFQHDILLYKKEIPIQYKNKQYLTDFERGEKQGQEKAYKKVLQLLHTYIDIANIKWKIIEFEIRKK